MKIIRCILKIFAVLIISLAFIIFDFFCFVIEEHSVAFYLGVIATTLVCTVIYAAKKRSTTSMALLALLVKVSAFIAISFVLLFAITFSMASAAIFGVFMDVPEDVIEYAADTVISSFNTEFGVSILFCVLPSIIFHFGAIYGAKRECRNTWKKTVIFSVPSLLVMISAVVLALGLDVSVWFVLFSLIDIFVSQVFFILLLLNRKKANHKTECSHIVSVTEEKAHENVEIGITPNVKQ